MAGAGATVDAHDPAICSGAGTWHPGGVVLAPGLALSTEDDVSWRLSIEVGAPGDILIGIIRMPRKGPPDISAEAEAIGLLDKLGYDYIMGREGAPASILYKCGGRCCFSLGDTTGPKVDHSEMTRETANTPVP